VGYFNRAHKTADISEQLALYKNSMADGSHPGHQMVEIVSSDLFLR